MSERFYAVDAGEGVWIYRLELDGYEAPVRITGLLVKDGRAIEGPRPVGPDDFAHNVANNGLREATEAEKGWLEREMAQEEEGSILYWSTPDDLDEPSVPPLE